MASVVEVKISIDGKDLSPFVSLSVRQEILSHQVCDLTCRTDTFDKFSASAEAFVIEKAQDLIGKKIKIDLKPIVGDKTTNTVTIFKGFIMEVHGTKYEDAFSGTVLLRGISNDIIMDGDHHCRSYENKTLDDIVNDVTKAYSKNLFDKSSVSARYKTAIPYVVQYNETNYGFLNRLAKTYGEWLLVTGENQFYFGEAPAAKANLLHGKDLQQFSFSMKLDTLKVNYSAYDYYKAETVQAKSKAPSGSSYLSKAINASNDLFTVETDVYHNFPMSKGKSNTELDTANKADMNSRMAGLNTARGSSDNPELSLGCKVEIKSFVDTGKTTKSIDYGNYRIIALHHSCDESGNYINEFEAVPASIEVPPQTNPQLFPVCETQSANVTETHDPEGMGRIRVRFFWQGKEQTPWLRTLTPHAGGGKGMFFIPEKGEEVLVGFENNNAEKPFVLGAQYNGKSHAGGFTNSNNDTKVLQSRSGHVIKLDDKDGNESITIMDKNGNIIVLNTKDKSISITAPEKISISAKEINIHGDDKVIITSREISESGDNKVEITSKEVSVNGDNKVSISSMQKIEESAASIELSAKTEAKISSAAQLKIEGTMVDITGSATTNVKGGMLNLN